MRRDNEKNGRRGKRMKKRITVLMLFVLLLGGCVAKPAQTEPATPETTAGIQTEPTVFVTIPEGVVTPGEMPQPPEGDAQLPPQPSLDIQTE